MKVEGSAGYDQGKAWDRILEADLHVHTYHSTCGFDRPDAIVAMAEQHGMRVVGFSDHYSTHPRTGCPTYVRPGPAIIAELRKELAAIQTDVKVYVGCEADMFSLDEPSIDAQGAAEVDYVLIAASHFHLPDSPQPQQRHPRGLAEHCLRYMRYALRLPFVDILAHPFHVSGNAFGDVRSYLETISDAELQEVALLATQNGIALEVNLAACSAPTYREAIARFLAICRETGTRLSLGSDAHKARRIGYPEEIFRWLEKIGLGEDDFICASEIVAQHSRKVRVGAGHRAGGPATN